MAGQISVPIDKFGSPLLYVSAAVICTTLENVTLLDRFAQQPFFRHGGWLISRAFHNSHKLLLYTGPKICIAGIGIAFFVLCLMAFFSRSSQPRLRCWRKPALLVLGSIILIPVIIAAIKALTGVYSPVALLPYGGKHPHIGFLEHLWLHGSVAGGASFPAGHASGGFALMALFFLPVRSGVKWALFGFGVLAGWGMGLYQMARGEHFLSHTLTTMLIALAVISLLDRVIPEWGKEG